MLCVFSCNEKFKEQHNVNRHIKTAKKHAGHRLASKFIDEYLLPFTCQVLDLAALLLLQQLYNEQLIICHLFVK